MVKWIQARNHSEEEITQHKVNYSSEEDENADYKEGEDRGLSGEDSNDNSCEEKDEISSISNKFEILSHED